ILALRDRQGPLDEQTTFEELETDGLAGVALLLRTVPPGLEGIPPRLDRVEVAGVFGEGDAPAPPVEAGVLERHRHLVPVRLVLAAAFQHGGDLLVAFAEDVGPDLQNVADLALHRISAVVDLRPDVLDDDRRAADLAQ